MSARKTKLIELRPVISSISFNDQMSSGEHFQNKTIRPVIKLQNDLLVEVFKNYVKKHKNVFYTLTIEKKYIYIENAIQRDVKFRNSLKGIIIGQFTVDEYKIYIQNSSSLNKRMMNITIERLKDQVQLFEKELAS